MKNKVGRPKGITKRQVTVTIDADILDAFLALTKNLTINRSAFLQNKMNDFLIKNGIEIQKGTDLKFVPGLDEIITELEEMLDLNDED